MLSLDGAAVLCVLLRQVSVVRHVCDECMRHPFIGISLLLQLHTTISSRCDNQTVRVARYSVCVLGVACACGCVWCEHKHMCVCVRVWH